MAGGRKGKGAGGREECVGQDATCGCRRPCIDPCTGRKKDANVLGTMGDKEGCSFPPLRASSPWHGRTSRG
jgi:hypothetical protein